MKRFLIATLALGACMAMIAQEKVEPYASVDLTSAYLWRGQKLAGVSLQPVAGLKWRGFNLYVWGNEQVSPPAGAPNKHEIDIFAKYSPCRYMTFGLKNVYVNTRGDGFLSYGEIPHAANGLDASVGFDFKYVNMEWSTTIAGYDGYDLDGERSYGSYLTIGAPFRMGWMDCTAQVGIVPYYCSRYGSDDSSGFHVNMCALKGSHKFSLADSGVDVTPYTQLMVNPSGRTAFFQVGVKFAYDGGK